MNKILLGSLVGLAATVPMTAWMKAWHQTLPEKERYPLPPRAVTMNLAAKAGIEPHLNEPERHTATIVAHFGFGAAAGAMYATVQEKLPLSPMIGGVCFGCAVWAASYLGWIPALGILPPATEHPARRNAIMITAHVVWGVSAGLLLQRAAAATTVITHPRALPKRQHQRPAS